MSSRIARHGGLVRRSVGSTDAIPRVVCQRPVQLHHLICMFITLDNCILDCMMSFWGWLCCVVLKRSCPVMWTGMWSARQDFSEPTELLNEVSQNTDISNWGIRSRDCMQQVCYMPCSRSSYEVLTMFFRNLPSNAAAERKYIKRNSWWIAKHFATWLHA